MLVNLIESVYRLLWGDLFTIPLGGGIGISFMVVLLFTSKSYMEVPVYHGLPHPLWGLTARITMDVVAHL